MLSLVLSFTSLRRQSVVPFVGMRHTRGAKAVLRSARHFLVGEYRVWSHGRGRFVAEVSKSILVLPVSLLCSAAFWIFRVETVICIARTGRLIASDFLHDFEPLKRAHRVGEFGRARVLFVSDGIPLGERLWNEIRSGSGIIFPRFPRLYRCMMPNGFVKRIYLTDGESSDERRRRFSLPAGVPPSQGLALPAPAMRSGLVLAPGERFALLNCQRPELFNSLRRASGIEPDQEYKDVGWENFSYQFPNLDNYANARAKLAQENYPVVDLWDVVGNPVTLFSSGASGGVTEKSERDELQTWLFANCEIFVSGTSGAWWIAWSLGKPTLIGDSMWLNFDMPMTMFVPILLWDKHEKRLLTLTEMWSGRGASIRRAIEDSRGRLEAVRNTPDELAAAIRELRALTRKELMVDEELQSRVLHIAKDAVGKPDSQKTLALVSQSFLSGHMEILA